MGAIKAPYSVTIEITVDADGWHLPTSEDYERRMTKREYIADFTQGKHGENVMPKQELIRCKDCKYKDDGIDEDGIPFLKCLNGRSYGGTRINDYCSWAERKEECGQRSAD